MSESIHNSRAYQSVQYFAAQSSLQCKARGLSAVLSLVLLLSAATANAAEVSSPQEPPGYPPEPSVQELVRAYFPRVLVASSLLGWGIMTDGQPADHNVILPAGKPATRNATLGTAGTAATMLTITTVLASALPALRDGDLNEAADRLSATCSVIGAAYAGRTYLKALFERPRPWAASGRLESDHDAFDSFPSGHSLLSWACVGSVAVGVAKGESRPATLGVVLTEAVAVSILRVAAGEHYPGDVIAGACLGILIGASVSFLASLR